MIVVFVINSFFSQSKTFSNMTEVVIAEDDGIGTLESNEEDIVRSLWNFCNSITLPRSEVLSLLLRQHHFSFLLKLTLDRPPCEELSVLFEAVGYILPTLNYEQDHFHQ